MRKLVRNYFLFAFVLALAGTTWQFPSAKNYIVSVLHSGETQVLQSKLVALPSKFNFSISSTIRSNYANPGQKSVEILKATLKPLENSFSLKNLRLKIVGVHPLAIEQATFVVNKNTVSTAKRYDEYLVFDDVNYSLKPNEEGTFSIKLDLNESLEAGKMIKLKIENSEDFLLLLNDVEYVLDGKFPLYTPVLTIVRSL